MTRDEIHQAVVDILSDIVDDVDWASFGMEDNLKGKLESMDFLDVIMELRKLYGIEVPEADYGHFATMKGCVDYLEPHLANK
ncbi:MAG: acyl carrier protein [Victivallales bacterium]|nr:acyl carrier protein [Victivallales bacterium]